MSLDYVEILNEHFEDSLLNIEEISDDEVNEHSRFHFIESYFWIDDVECWKIWKLP